MPYNTDKFLWNQSLKNSIIDEVILFEKKDQIPLAINIIVFTQSVSFYIISYFWVTYNIKRILVPNLLSTFVKKKSRYILPIY